MSDRKRAHPIDSKDGDTPTKKARLGEQTASAGGANGGGTSASNLAAMRAKVAAKFATFQSGGPSAGGGSSQPSSSSIQSKNTPSVGSASGGSSNAAEMARKIAETKRRVQEGMAKQKAAASANPYLVSLKTFGSDFTPLIWLISCQGGGQGGSQSLAAARAKALADQANNAKPGTGIHPALLDNTPSAPSSSKDRYKPMAPKFSSTSVGLVLPVPGGNRVLTFGPRPMPVHIKACKLARSLNNLTSKPEDRL